jgi:hypothetical protein
MKTMNNLAKDPSDVPKGRLGKFARVSFLVVCIFFLMVSSFFHFDFRFLSGFAVWEPAGELGYCPLPMSARTDSIKAVYVSNRNQYGEAGEPPSNGSVFTEGPTIIICQSGRWRVNHGAIIGYYKDGLRFLVE